MDIEYIVDTLVGEYDDLVIHNVYGETAIMLNPGNKLAKGKYFCTLKDYDGPNDKASYLDRDKDTFRLNLKISKRRFLKLFSQDKLPSRPPKGDIIFFKDYEIDFKKVNTILPHPIYGWMSWIGIINPSKATFKYLFNHGFFDDAYQHAKSLIKN